MLKNEFNANGTFNDANESGKNYRNKLDYVYQNVEFRGQFKTPSLRNVALTHPYMHTGEFENLAEVIDYYNTVSERMDEANHQEVLLKSLNLSPHEQSALLAFLNTLTDDSVIKDIMGGE
ncbi:MAG: hypothetical protein ACWA5U_10545 [bacterium]